MSGRLVADRYFNSSRFMRAAAIAEPLERRCLLSAGVIDKSFGASGAAYGELFPGGDATAVALQKDGKIVVAGVAPGRGVDQNFALARFNANGSLDRTFGINGRVQTDLGDVMENPGAVAIAGDGKILVAGSSGGSSTDSHFAVVRYLPGGKLDSTFGAGGISTVTFLGGDLCNAMAIQPSGQIVVAGSAVGPAGLEEFAVARLTSSGKLDNTFGAGGKVLTRVMPGAAADSIALQGNGEIVVGGWANTVVVARYQSNGTLDRTFAKGGLFLQGAPSDPDFFFQSVKLGIETNGTIVAGTGFGDITVVRLTAGGAVDRTFGYSGTATLAGTDHSLDGGTFYVLGALAVAKSGAIDVIASQEFDPGAFSGPLFITSMAVGFFTTAGKLTSVTTTPLVGQSSANAAALQSDGKLVVAGQAFIGSYNDFALARYTTAGTLDRSFGYYGAVQQPDGITGLINAIAVQHDGKILVAGTEQSPDGVAPTDAALARYNANGTLDTTFGIDGRVFLNLGSSAAFNALTIESNGDIVAGGIGQTGPGGAIGRFAIVRLLPSGKLDSTFAASGFALTSFPNIPYAQCTALAVDAAGDIIAVGAAVLDSNPANPNAIEIAAARYLSNGALDPLFGSSGRVVLNPLAGGAAATSVAQLKNGKILIVGAINGDMGAIRLQPNGSLDPTFGTRGFIRTVFFPGQDNGSIANAMAIDPAGDIILGGSAVADNPQFFSFGNDSALARYLPNGQLDQSFGQGGKIMDYSLGFANGINSMVLQSDGKIVAGGVTTLFVNFVQPLVSVRPFLGMDPPTLYSAVARFTSTGIDSTFGSNGIIAIDSGVIWNTTNTVVAMQPDGKILAADIDLYRLEGK